MLLAIDAGNTTVRFGLFKGKKLIQQWSKPTKLLVKGKGLQFSKGLKPKISGIIIS